MKQYSLNEKIIVLKVKKSPLFIRIVMFFFAFASFLIPVVATIMSIAIGKGLQIGYFIGLFLFGLIGFRLLKIALWNTYGKETIIWNSSTLKYEANYGWFNDQTKTIKLSKIDFFINKIGYAEEKIGTLVIGDESEKIESAIKMPTVQIEELIVKLKKIEQTGV